MSLRDLLHGRRTGSDTTGAGPRPAGSGTEITEFAPRTDGEYRCAARGLYLRFARPIVTETDSAHDVPATGEFTTAGRFVVQRRFSRPIVYTVVTDRRGEDTGDDAGYDATLVVRRTDTVTRTTERLEFAFRPDRQG